MMRIEARGRWVGSGIVLLSGLLAAPSGEAQTNWRTTMGVFRIGIAADSNHIDGRATEQVRGAYAKVLGLPVEIFVARDQAALIDAQASGRVDYAIYSALGYATAWRLCACVEPIAAPVAEDGTTGIRAVLLARSERASALAQLSGGTIATAAGDLVGAQFVWPEALGDPARRLELPSMEAAEAAFVAGKADALLGWAPAGVKSAAATPRDGTLAHLAAARVDVAGLAELWTSADIRFGPHAVRVTLDRQAKSVLAEYLSNMKAADIATYEIVDGGVPGGFAPVTPADYRSALDVVDALAKQ